MSDPTYDREAIDANPVWLAAFIMSEHLNDAAPIGWGRYIPIARSLEKEGLLAKREEDTEKIRMSERDPVKLIASIMRKAQHRSAADINEPIEIGEECWRLRMFVDRARIAEQREAELVGMLDEAIAEIEASHERGRPAFIEFAVSGRDLLAKYESQGNAE